MIQIFGHQVSRFILLGFISTAGQIILLREYLTLHRGNELSLGLFLGVWLFWTGLGSYLAGRFGNTQSLLRISKNWLQFLFAVFIPITLLFLRLSPAYWQVVPGEESGLSNLLFSSFLVIAPFCIISGALFSVLAKVDTNNAETDEAISVSQVYIFETIGSASAGLILSLLFILSIPPISIAFFLTIIGNLPFLADINWQINRKYIAALVSVFILLSASILYASNMLEKFTLQVRWKNFNLTGVKYSRYGQLAVLRNAENCTIYENGLTVTTFPDRQTAEEAVHYALLMHPNPQTVLLIGGGLSGSAAEILKYPNIRQIDYVELDPEIIRFVRSQVNDIKNYLPDDSRLKIYHEDGRMFMKKQSIRYDVILAQLPDPHTAQLNRFYTREFFMLCRERLSDKGILSFQAQSAENYISDELASYLCCLLATAKEVFPCLAILPGEKAQFFAGTNSSVIRLDAELFINRLETREVETQFVNKYFIPLRLMPERLQYFQERLDANNETGINSDFTPRAYYLATTLWGRLFSKQFAEILSEMHSISFTVSAGIPIILLFMSLLFIYPAKKQHKVISYSALLSIFVTGFSALSLEILVLLIYQSFYGYIYLALAFIIAVFMAGMSTGSWFGKRFLILSEPGKSQLNLVLLHSGQLVCLLFIIFMIWFPIPYIFLNPFIAALTFGSGMITGCVFPVANHLYFKASPINRNNTGLIYSTDLFGAVAGALMINIFYIPLYGFIQTSVLLIFIHLEVILILSFLSIARRQPNKTKGIHLSW